MKLFKRNREPLLCDLPNQVLLDVEEEDIEHFSENDSDEEGRLAKTLRPQKKSSTITVIYSIINTAVGGSIFGYPYVVSQFGLIFGTFMIFFGAFLTCFTSKLCQKVKNLSHHTSYATIAQACFGKIGHTVVSIVIVINALGSCLTYFIVFTIVVENMMLSYVPTCSPSYHPTPIYCEKYAYAAVAALFILPFNFKKSFTRLKHVSFLKVVSILLFTGITVVHGISVLIKGKQGNNIHLAPSTETPVSFIAAFPQVMLGYNFMYNQYTLYKTMDEPSDSKFGKAVKVGMGFAAIMCFLIGIFGYVIYGDRTTNILKNFTKEDLGDNWYVILNFAFLVSSLTGVPVTFFPARNIIYHEIVKHTEPRQHNEEIETMQASFPRLSRKESFKKTKQGKKLFNAVVIILTIIIVVVAIVTPDLNLTLGLIGSIGINSINFLFPTAFYLKLSSRKGKTRIAAYAVFVMGMFIGIGGLVANSIKISTIWTE